jgi:hypothetical protein
MNPEYGASAGKGDPSTARWAPGQAGLHRYGFLHGVAGAHREEEVGVDGDGESLEDWAGRVKADAPDNVRRAIEISSARPWWKAESYEHLQQVRRDA